MAGCFTMGAFAAAWAERGNDRAENSETTANNPHSKKAAKAFHHQEPFDLVATIPAPTKQKIRCRSESRSFPLLPSTYYTRKPGLAPVSKAFFKARNPVSGQRKQLDVCQHQCSQNSGTISAHCSSLQAAFLIAPFPPSSSIVVWDAFEGHHPARRGTRRF